MKRIPELWGWKESPFSSFPGDPESDAFCRSPNQGITSLLICIRSGLVTNSQVQYVGTRVEGPHDTKPDALNKNLLLASLLRVSLEAGRIRTSMPRVRSWLPQPIGFPCSFHCELLRPESPFSLLSGLIHIALSLALTNYGSCNRYSVRTLWDTHARDEVGTKMNQNRIFTENSIQISL